MSGSQKVYVIDSGKRKPSVDLNLPPDNAPAKGAAGNYLASSAAREKARQVGRRSGVPLLLLYCSGPFAIFATPQGRRGRAWMITALLSVILATVAMRSWGPVVSPAWDGSRSALVLLIAACAALIAGFAAWARGVFLIGRQEGARVRRIPEWLKRPAGTGMLGLLVPGLGLLVAGHARRAAAALWVLCATLVSVLILSQADWLWRFNRQAGALALSSRALESIFIATGVCALLGAVLWIAQALVGVRCAAKGNGPAAAARASAVLAVLCAAFIVTGLASRREPLADALDYAARALHAEGLEIVPLAMAEAAMRLDPSQPAYMANAAALYESAGHSDKALTLRRVLIERLEPCIGVLEEEGLVVRAAKTAQPVPVQAAGPADPAEMLLPAELLIVPRLQDPFGP